MFFIKSLFLRLLKAKHWLSQYYFPGVLIVSIFLGGALFGLSWLRSGENSISSKIMSCFEKKDPRKCSRKFLRGKRLKNRTIEKIVFTRCFCKSLYLSYGQVYNSDLRDNNFNQSFFYKMSFIGVNFFKSFFYGSVLEDVVFKDSDLGGVKFNFATLRNVSFENIDLSSSLFIGAQFEYVSYDKNTKLPFSESEAHQKGWVLRQ